MPKWLKVVLVLLGVLVLLCGLSGLGAYVWFNENREKLKGVQERAQNEGSAFAYEHNAEECVDEALRRLELRSGVIDQAEHKLFLKACLKKAERPPAFCLGIPPRGELIAFAKWTVERCAAKGQPQNQDCSRLMQGLQEACQ